MSRHDNRNIAAVEASFQIATRRFFSRVATRVGHQDQWPPVLAADQRNKDSYQDSLCKPQLVHPWSDVRDLRSAQAETCLAAAALRSGPLANLKGK